MVAIDDASPYDTATLLEMINDSRFIFERNKKNPNFVLNFTKVVRRTKSLWVLAHNDEGLVTTATARDLIYLVSTRSARMYPLC